jgi:hypothetical protein
VFAEVLPCDDVEEAFQLVGRLAVAVDPPVDRDRAACDGGAGGGVAAVGLR